MDAFVDMKHGSIMPRYIAVSQSHSSQKSAIERGRDFSRSRHNTAMVDDRISDRPDLGEVVDRVMSVHGDRLHSPNNWAKMAGKNESTLRSAMRGNPTVSTLHAIAKAAGMTVVELLEYGEPDWEQRVRARQAANAILEKMTSRDEAIETGKALQANRKRRRKPRDAADESSG
ncbi:hypothetical protein J2847_005829 [Azospirillum agricola]|uniref:hypothetical protein n=1 Tax=Azospirillum agricola TaxID=1720247 RepID=UPI001AE2903F|nr:hypothetical protein [Azospirillum agricola]MBP2232500.1 hypothetical protein [Azospirillum agricola]